MAIRDTEGLHKAIGLWLVDRPIPLNGAELRFLQIEMELSQRDLAGILGVKEQRLRIWKKGRGNPIPGPAIDCFGQFIPNSSRAILLSGACPLGRAATRNAETAGKWRAHDVIVTSEARNVPKNRRRRAGNPMPHSPTNVAYFAWDCSWLTERPAGVIRIWRCRIVSTHSAKPFASNGRNVAFLTQLCRPRNRHLPRT